MDEKISDKKPSMFKFAATYGIVIGLSLIVLSTIDFVFKIYGENILLGILNYIVMVGGIIILTIMYRDKVLDGYISYKESVILGILLIVFASIISGVFSFILYSIDPSYLAVQLEKAADKLAQQGMSDDQIEQALILTKKMMSPLFILISSILGGAIMGTIFSLITSIFTKRQRSIF